jgi:DNA-binding MarR family transcriptional regulator
MTVKETIGDRPDYGAFIPSQLDDYPLSPTEFRIFCHISRRAGTTEGKFWESRRNAATHCLVEPTTYDRSILILEQAGLIRVKRHPNKPHEISLMHYKHWAKPEHLKEIREAIPSKRKKKTGGNCIPERVGELHTTAGGNCIPERVGELHTTAGGNCSPKGTPSKLLPIEGTPFKVNTPLIPQGGNAGELGSVLKKSEVFETRESATEPSALINSSPNTPEAKIPIKSSAAARRAKKSLLAAAAKPTRAPDKFEAWWMIFRGHAQKANCRPGDRAEAVASWDVLHEVGTAAGDDLLALAAQILDGTEAYWQREHQRTTPSVKNGCRFLAKRDWLEALEWQQLHEASTALTVAPQYAPFLQVWNQDRPMTWPTADEDDLDRDTVRQLERLIATCNGTSLERFQKALQYVRRDEYWGLQRVLSLKEFLYSTRLNEWSKKQLHHESLGIGDRVGGLATAAKQAKRDVELNQILKEMEQDDARKRQAESERDAQGNGAVLWGTAQPNASERLHNLLSV